jgi:hypothetical protein
VNGTRLATYLITVNLKKADCLDDFGAGGKIILKLILQK